MPQCTCLLPYFAQSRAWCFRRILSRFDWVFACSHPPSAVLYDRTSCLPAAQQSLCMRGAWGAIWYPLLGFNVPCIFGAKYMVKEQNGQDKLLLKRINEHADGPLLAKKLRRSADFHVFVGFCHVFEAEMYFLIISSEFCDVRSHFFR